MRAVHGLIGPARTRTGKTAWFATGVLAYAASAGRLRPMSTVPHCNGQRSPCGR